MKPDITLAGDEVVILRRDDEALEATVIRFPVVRPGMVQIGATESLRVGPIDVFGPALVEIRRPS